MTNTSMPGAGARLRRGVAAPARAWRALDDSGADRRRLYFGRPSSARRALIARALLALSLILVVTLVFIFDREGLRDSIDNHVSVIDAIYFSMITITTVGYGDIVPVTQGARLFDAFFVTPIRLIVWAIFLGTAYQFVVQRLIEDIRMRIRQSELANHIVICGFGLGGRSAAVELMRRGFEPEKIVVIDANESAVLAAAELGLVGLRGDATREAILKDARVHSARTAIVSLGRDDTSVLAVLTLRALAPGLRIVCAVKEAENEPLMHRGGATATICPSTLGGTLLASSLDSSKVATYVNDMLTFDGRVMLTERLATDDDIGREPREFGDGIVLRIHRGEKLIGFWEPGARIRPGDQLLILRPSRADFQSATDGAGA